MRYTIRTTGTESGKGFRHEFLRGGKLTSYAEYGPHPNPPKRMQRWLKKLNAEIKKPEHPGRTEMLRQLHPPTRAGFIDR